MEKKQPPPALKAYLRRQVVTNVLFNAALNALLPYLMLDSSNAVPLLQGDPSIAATLLPLFFLLPTLLTAITLVQLRGTVRRGRLSLPLSTKRLKGGAILRAALVNGMLSLLLGSALLLLFRLAGGTTLTPFSLILLSSFSAAALAAIFSIQPVYSIQKSIS